MKRTSKKMDKIERTYSKLRKEFLLENPMCQLRKIDCSLTATDIHHKKGRGKYHLDITTWMSLCRNCHKFVHDHFQEGYDRGYL